MTKIPAAPRGGTVIVVRVLTDQGRPVRGATIEIVGLRGRPNPSDPDAVWRSTANKTDLDGEKWWQLSPAELAQVDTVTVHAWKDRYRPALSTAAGYDPADGATAQQAINRDAETVIELRLKSCCLAKYTDLKEQTPARALPVTDARDVLLALHASNQLTLTEEPEFGDPAGRETPQPSADCGGCGLRNYQVGPHPSNTAAASSVFVTMQRIVAGVEWIYVGEYSALLSFWKAKGAGVIRNVDARLAVGLYRLSKFLQTQWHVTKIYHVGIGQGSGSSNDCHNTGRAIDFGGVTMEHPELNGGSPTSFHVYLDWFHHPASWPAAPPDATRVKGEGIPTSVPNLQLPPDKQPDEHRLPDWPADWGRTPEGGALPANVPVLHYRLRRLAPDSAGSIYPAGVCRMASDLWSALYDFAAGQFENHTVGAAAGEAPVGIGGYSWIMSPDCAASAALPSPHGRQKHANHFHFQVGR